MNSATSKKKIPLHHFDLSCSRCHDPANANEDRKMRQGTIGRMSVGINWACSSSGCHDYNPVLNHPVGVSVSGAIPDDLPLDDSERITCLTCHLEPGSSTDAGTEDSQDERMLRMPDGADLCSSCHLQMAGMGQQGQSHWRFSNRAHLGSINAQSNSAQVNTYNIGSIDSESRSCLSCHEDITVTIPGYNETPTQKRARRAKMGDHPIGMDYSRIAMRKMGKYNYPLTNAGQIRFFDGKVGCGSCHSLYSRERKYLVQSNFRSALCFECHNM
jgi:predicted CXXCH cytochrome family protein